MSRDDYSSYEAKQEAIVEIYQWLNTQPDKQDSAINLAGWKGDIEGSLSYLLEKPAESGKKIPSGKPSFNHYYHILTGKNEEAKKAKFQKLVKILLAEQWISETENPGVYQYRNTEYGARLLLGALYYSLNRQGHIEKKLKAPQIVGFFNNWLLHDLSQESFKKVFQAEEQDKFNCLPSQTRYKYIRDCNLLIKSL